MTLEELKAMAEEGSYLEDFIHGLENQLPFPDMDCEAIEATSDELKAVAEYLYETFGLTILIDDWAIHEDYDAAYVMDYLPLTEADCDYLLSREVDSTPLSILHRVYPKGKLPLERYRDFSMQYKIRCLDAYKVSNKILDYEVSRVDSLKEVLDADLFDEWLTTLVETLEYRGRYDDSDPLYDRYPQLN